MNVYTDVNIAFTELLLFICIRQENLPENKNFFLLVCLFVTAEWLERCALWLFLSHPYDSILIFAFV